MLNQLVDKIFVITTHNSERLDYIRPHLDKWGFDYEFFIAPDIEILSKEKVVNHQDTSDVRPSLSLLSANASILRSSQLNKYKSIAILEDDCYFCEGWIEKFNRFYSNLPSDWQLLNVGYHPFHVISKSRSKINEYVCVPLEFHTSSHCMMIKSVCFDALLALHKKFNYSIPIDILYIQFYKDRRFQSYTPHEDIIHQISCRKDCIYDIPGIELRFKSVFY